MHAAATFDLSERVAIVTGASSGIGTAIAEGLAGAGATVSLVGRNAERLDAVRDGIVAAGGSAASLAVDLASADGPAEVVRRTLATHGRIDVIVHSAGLFFPKAFPDITADELRQQWEVNVQAPFLLTQAALPHLDGRASVIFISSMMGDVGGAMCTAYCATKGAVEQLSKALAVELGASGVRFNTIAPGAVETPMNEAFREDEEFYESFRAFPPAGRWGQATDIAPAAVFLASDAAAFVHGARLAVDGGWVAR